MSGGASRIPADAGMLEQWLYRPILSRATVAAWTALVGLVLLLVLDLPLPLRYFWLLAAWVGVSAVSLHLLDRRRHARFFFPARFALFSFELLIAAWVGQTIGASSWVLTLFLLFPAIEWNMLYPGAWGLAGSGLAVLAVGALIFGETLGYVPPGALFPSIDSSYDEMRYAVAAFLVCASIIVELSSLVGRYAEASRRNSRRLRAANDQLTAMSEDLRQSHAEVEEAYGQLRNTQAELVSSAKLATLGHLIAGVAHEINTPLGALNSNHDTIRRALGKLQVILEDEVVDEHELADVRRIVKAIEGVMGTNDMAVERMLEMVDSLRSFGRPDRSEIDRVDLHEGIDSTLAIIAHEMKGRVRVEKEYGDLPLVECYPGQVHQIFMNLIVNALQAIQGEGVITIRTRPEGDEVAIEIEDSGVGISHENLSRIFDPGFTTKGSRMGMGLGLLITSQIIDRHGGRIAVESELGRGTLFTVHLPVRMELADPESESEGDGRPESAGMGAVDDVA